MDNLFIKTQLQHFNILFLIISFIAVYPFGERYSQELDAEYELGIFI